MPRPKPIPENWRVIQQGSGPGGPYTIWRNGQTEEEVQLPKGMVPDANTLKLLVFNGAIARAPEPGDAGELLEPATVPETPLDRVLSILSDRGDNERSEVRIFRVKDTGRDVYMGMFTAEEFEERNLDLIRLKFGPGQYRIVVMGYTPKFDGEGNTIPHGGKFVPLMRPIVEVGESLEPLRPTEIQQNPANSAFSPALEKLNQRLDQMSQGGMGDPQTQLMQMMGMMKMMREAFGMDAAPKAKTLLEQLQELQAVRELASNFAEKGESEGGLMGMASKMMDMVGPVIEKAQQAKAEQAAAQPVPILSAPPAFQAVNVSPLRPNPAPAQQNSPQPSSPAAINQPSGDIEMGLQDTFISAMVRAACADAAKNEPFEPWAQDLALRVSDEMLDMLELQSWWKTLSAMYPEIAPHQEWFTKLRDRLLELTAEPDDAGSDTVEARRA